MFEKFKSIVNLNLKCKPAIAISNIYAESKFIKSKESQSLIKDK